MYEELQTRTTLDRFHITAKITAKKFSYRDLQSRGQESNETAEGIILVPEASTERDLFYRTWLPPKLSPDELKDKELAKNAYHELVFETGSPIFGYFRGALCAADFRLDQPHIFVMTKKAEELLKPYIGQKIRLSVLGENEEEGLYQLEVETKSPVYGMK